MTERPTLLLTRPHTASARFAASLRAMLGDDWPIVESPLLDIVLLTPPADDVAMAAAADQVIFTSENGVEGLAALLPARGRVAWCVGGRTAAAARAVGYQAIAAEGDAPSLRALIGAAAPRARLVHARGRHIVAPLAQQLTAAGLPCTEITVYDQIERQLSAAARAALAGPAPVIAPLFSPRSARIFARAAAGAAAPIWLAAMSPAVADAAAALAPARLAVADRPEAGAVLAAVRALLADAAG